MTAPRPTAPATPLHTPRGGVAGPATPPATAGVEPQQRLVEDAASAGLAPSGVAAAARCADCQRPLRRNRGRGLCGACYNRHRRAGTLADYPRRYFTRDEILAEYEWLHVEGYSRRQIAERLGISDDGLHKALKRAGVAT